MYTHRRTNRWEKYAVCMQLLPARNAKRGLSCHATDLGCLGLYEIFFFFFFHKLFLLLQLRQALRATYAHIYLTAVTLTFDLLDPKIVATPQ